MHNWLSIHGIKYQFKKNMKFDIDNVSFYFSYKILKSEPDSDPSQFVMPLLMVFWSFAFIFFYCELGQSVTNQFNHFDDALCQCKWYLCSVDLQQMLLTFMSDTQQPMLLRGYANIVCARDSFKNVTKNPNKIGQRIVVIPYILQF